MYNIEIGEKCYGKTYETKNAYRHASDVIRYMKRTVYEDPANLGSRVVSCGKECILSEIIEKYLTFLVSEIRTVTIRREFQNNKIEAVTITVSVGIA